MGKALIAILNGSQFFNGLFRAFLFQAFRNWSWSVAVWNPRRRSVAQERNIDPSFLLSAKRWSSALAEKLVHEHESSAQVQDIFTVFCRIHMELGNAVKVPERYYMRTPSGMVLFCSALRVPPNLADAVKMYEKWH